MVRDSSYHPDKIIFNSEIHNLYNTARDPSTFVAAHNSQDIILPNIPNKEISSLIQQAKENSVSLGGFRMNINTGLGI
jgi:hypothetical protein